MAYSYFTLTVGLRGCYMPAVCYIVRVKTRKELKSVVSSEADVQRGDTTVGLSKKTIASFVAWCWRNRDNKMWNMGMELPFDDRDSGSKLLAIFLSRSSRADYDEYQENEGNN